jgi:hypothetical protein
MLAGTATCKVTAPHPSRPALLYVASHRSSKSSTKHRVGDPPVRPARQSDRAGPGRQPGRRLRRPPGPLRRSLQHHKLLLQDMQPTIHASAAIRAQLVGAADLADLARAAWLHATSRWETPARAETPEIRPEALAMPARRPVSQLSRHQAPS